MNLESIIKEEIKGLKEHNEGTSSYETKVVPFIKGLSWVLNMMNNDNDNDNDNDKQTFVFEKSTNTIRTSPANILVAHKLEENGLSYGDWQMTSDRAIPEHMAIKCLMVLRNNHTACWSRDGEVLLKALLEE